MKRKRKISKETTAYYLLIKEDEEYSIIIEEKNLENETTDFAKADRFTSNEAMAKSFFAKIVKNKVCACTLCDIICDLMCWNGED